MTDSHLPNSHPKVTPGWTELGYERTSFDKAIALQAVDGQKGVYSGFGPLDWCAPHDRGHCLHGGYIAALFVAASRAYHRDYYINLKQPDPIQMNVRYLTLTPPGAFRIRLTDIHQSPRVSTIRGELITGSHIPIVHALALFTMGNLNDTSGHSVKLPPIPTPDRERDCSRYTNPLVYNIMPFMSAVRSYCPNDGDRLDWSPNLGQNARDHWTKLDSDENFRLEHIAFLGDWVPVIPMNFEKDPAHALRKYQYVTLSIDFDFRADPNGKHEWILNRAKTYKIHRGHFDMHMQMVDDDGDLIATAKHACTVFEHKRGKKNKGLHSL